MISSYEPDIFHKNNFYTVGMELEVRLLNRNTFRPENSSPYLIKHIPEQLKPHIHKELLQSMLEVVTPVCQNPTEAVKFIKNTLGILVDIGIKKDIGLAALATHPFEKKEDNEIVHDPRYEAFAQELQIVLKNFLIMLLQKRSSNT